MSDTYLHPWLKYINLNSQKEVAVFILCGIADFYDKEYYNISMFT